MTQMKRKMRAGIYKINLFTGSTLYTITLGFNKGTLIRDQDADGKMILYKACGLAGAGCYFVNLFFHRNVFGPALGIDFVRSVYAFVDIEGIDSVVFVGQRVS